ncbi:subunit of tubulin prefoldin [Xylographa trunciseda]|nr:subunit of tubulin prefoldin [Xylographa trunciseda]
MASTTEPQGQIGSSVTSFEPIACLLIRFQVDLASLSVQQLSSVKKRLDDELEHLSISFTKLRAAQTKFRECLTSIREGVSAKTAGIQAQFSWAFGTHDADVSTGKALLVPLTTSLYVPGTLADADKVMVDVGTGFFIEKAWASAVLLGLTLTQLIQDTKDALQFYNSKIEDLGKNLKDLESIVQGKSNNLRFVEDGMSVDYYRLGKALS